MEAVESGACGEGGGVLVNGEEKAVLYEQEDRLQLDAQRARRCSLQPQLHVHHRLFESTPQIKLGTIKIHGNTK